MQTSRMPIAKRELSLADVPNMIRDLWMPWNSPLHLVLLVFTLCCTRSAGWWCLLLYPLILFLNDISIFALNKTMIDPTEVIVHGYAVSRWIDSNGSATGDGLDYGFNFYNGDYTKSRKQAQLDKFEFAFKSLGLKRGMKLLDCGCGCGDWLYWLKTEKGVEVHGINITPAQVAICRERGLTVECTDWKAIARSPELQKTLYGQFDAVSFWDTIEHYVPMNYFRNTKKQDQVYRDMFAMAVNCLNPQSECHRIWTSCLHIRFNGLKLLKMPWKQMLHRMYYVWLLDKFHSGIYPGYGSDQLMSNAKALGITEVGRLDTTLDYYKTSEINPSHFGKHKFELSFFKLVLFVINFFLDPAWLPRLLWLLHESWMHQFDGRSIEHSDMVMWWIWMEAPKHE